MLVGPRRPAVLWILLAVLLFGLMGIAVAMSGRSKPRPRGGPPEPRATNGNVAWTTTWTTTDTDPTQRRHLGDVLDPPPGSH